MKRSIIVIFSIIAGYVLATFLAVALLGVGIDIPAMFAKTASEYNMYGGVEVLLLTIGFSWAMYQVLARRFLEKKASEPTSTVSSPVATAVGSPSPASQSHVEVLDIQPAVSPPSSGPVVSPAPPSNQDASFGPGRWNVLEVRAVPGLGADQVVTVEQSGDSWQFIHPVVGRVASSRVDQTAVQVVGQRVTVTNARDGISLTLWPVGSARPTASNGRPAVPGQAIWTRPTPWLVAVGLALAWGILSVGPARLASDIGEVPPRDTVTAPSCHSNSTPAGSRCVTTYWTTDLWTTGLTPRSVYSAPGCYSESFSLPSPVLEADGMCHERSGGDVKPLVGDVLRGTTAGLLAFLVIGAAVLLLWPRPRVVTHNLHGTIQRTAAQTTPTTARFPGPVLASSPTEPTASSQKDAFKVCPQCAEEVKAAALICRYCRYKFRPATTGCRNCGYNRTPPGKTSCYNCGRPLGPDPSGALPPATPDRGTTAPKIR